MPILLRRAVLPAAGESALICADGDRGGDGEGEGRRRVEAAGSGSITQQESCVEGDAGRSGFWGEFGLAAAGAPKGLPLLETVPVESLPKPAPLVAKSEVE